MLEVLPHLYSLETGIKVVTKYDMLSNMKFLAGDDDNDHDDNAGFF
jgi:hypothetical protein